MKSAFPYAENLSFVCADCGFVILSPGCPAGCPACGSRSVDLADELKGVLAEFASGAMVEIRDRGIWVAKVPVTQMVWRLVTGENPSRFRGDELPVESVSYEDCLAFLERLNRVGVFRKSGLVYRLPTSDEWSFFARRGRRKFAGMAWSWRNSDGSPHPVATKAPNAFGLYDLYGNVWEWCRVEDGSDPVCRGGCWCCDEAGCNLQESWPRGTRHSFIGLRLCAEAAE